jgi:hypothetical protein
LDDLRNLARALALGNGHLIHDGRPNPHSASPGRNHGNHQALPRSKRRLIAESKMKPIIVAGILLVVLGALALAYQGITYTKREKVIDIGPIHATADTQKTIPLPPILGGIALLGGVGLLVAGAKRTA